MSERMTEQRLVDLALAVIVEGRGVATTECLRARGLSAEHLAILVAERLLVTDGDGQYELAEPLVDLDPLVLAHWAVPTGIFGGVTALVYRYLSVARLPALDVFVSEGVTVPAVVADTPLRRHVLPPSLLAVGVDTLTPSLPGTVAVPFFTPTVALAQTLADRTIAAETCQDAVLEYLAAFGRDAALADALERYQVAPSAIDTLVAQAAR